jgi:hypothetical protein
MEPWITLVTQAGLGVAIALFLVKYTTDKLTASEKFIQEKLLGTIQASNAAQSSTAAAIAELCRVLREKPCLYDLEQRGRKQRDKTEDRVHE